MSLKVVHAIFISVSLALGIFVMSWSWAAYQYYQQVGYLGVLFCVLIMECGVVIYLKQYLKKWHSW